jgi:hypothetical protein
LKTEIKHNNNLAKRRSPPKPSGIHGHPLKVAATGCREPHFVTKFSKAYQPSLYKEGKQNRN